MAGLQRSNETFRRSGSSGMVWEDRFLSGELKPASDNAKSDVKEGGAGAPPLERNRSGGHGGYRAGHVPPALDPPSPRVAVCGFCKFFGKAKTNANTNAKARRH